MHFVFCPKQGNKIEGVVLNGVRILGIFCPKKGQGLENSKFVFIKACGGNNGS